MRVELSFPNSVPDVKGQNRGRRVLGERVGQKVCKTLLLRAPTWKSTLYICKAKVLRSPVIKEPASSFDPGFPIFIGHTPCRLNTLRSSSEQHSAEGQLGNIALQKLSDSSLISTSWSSHCRPLACLPSAVDSDQPKHLNLVLSWTGSLKTVPALCNPS